jgi:hypothetical protein
MNTTANFIDDEVMNIFGKILMDLIEKRRVMDHNSFMIYCNDMWKQQILNKCNLFKILCYPNLTSSDLGNISIN